jgi:hypothetical protein
VSAKAVFFDVDPSRFPEVVLAASSILDDQQEHIYDADIFVRYTRRIFGGSLDPPKTRLRRT